VGDAGVASFEKGDVPAAVQSARVVVASADGVRAASCRRHRGLGRLLERIAADDDSTLDALLREIGGRAVLRETR
jgi:hypothetical protein